MEMDGRDIGLNEAKKEMMSFIQEWSKKHKLDINRELELIADYLHRTLGLCRKNGAKEEPCPTTN